MRSALGAGPAHFGPFFARQRPRKQSSRPGSSIASPCLRLGWCQKACPFGLRRSGPKLHRYTKRCRVSAPFGPSPWGKGKEETGVCEPCCATAESTWRPQTTGR
jgi:hypothetical protein